MLRDTSGHLQDLVQQFINETDAAARHTLTILLIYAWAGVENIDPAGMIYRNAIGDARKLATLEAVLDEPYLGTWCWGERDPNPHGPAAKVLLQAFDQLSSSIYGQLLVQTHVKSRFDSIRITTLSPFILRSLNWGLNPINSLYATRTIWRFVNSMPVCCAGVL